MCKGGERQLDVNEKVEAWSQQLADKVDKTRKQMWPMEDWVRIAFAACTSDLRAFEVPLDANRKRHGGVSPRR